MPSEAGIANVGQCRDVPAWGRMLKPRCSRVCSPSELVRSAGWLGEDLAWHWRRRMIQVRKLLTSIDGSVISVKTEMNGI